MENRNSWADGLYLRESGYTVGPASELSQDLSSYERVLLSLDGTVTTFMEAWYGEAVAVKPVVVERVSLQCSFDLLGLDKGSDILVRKIFMTGVNSGVLRAFATARLAIDRLPEPIASALVKGGAIGRCFVENRFETFRNVLSWRVAAPEDLDQFGLGIVKTSVLQRRYTIHHQNQPIAVVDEFFPRNGDVKCISR